MSGAAPTVDGRNGTTTQAGHGMPRWEQVAGQGSGFGASPAATLVTRLAVVVGDVGGQDVERLEWDAPWRVMALTLFGLETANITASFPPNDHPTMWAAEISNESMAARMSFVSTGQP